MPSVSEYPHCCGMQIWSYFTSQYMDYVTYTQEDKVRIRDWIKNKIKVTVNIGMVLVALNETQVAAGLGDVLLDEEFKDFTGPFYHPGHQRYITLYGYEIHPTKRKPVPKPVPEIKEVEQVPIPRPTLRKRAMPTPRTFVTERERWG